MADDEFVVLDDDSDEENHQNLEESINQLTDSNQKSNNILIYSIIILVFSILVALGIFIYLSLNKQKLEHSKEVNASQIIQNINERKLTDKELTHAQILIQKADRLYKNGNKEEALKIYEELSLYNKALSHYNIGVAQLKDKNYKDAIKSFGKAMQNDALKCPSAINACVCGIYLKDQSTFKHYLSLSKKYLPYLHNTPLYSYYLSIIHYYYDQPLESAIVIENSRSNFYKNEQNLIASKIFSVFDNNELAIKHLNKINNPKNALTRALIRARLGEYSLAADSLDSAIKQNIEPLKSNIALSLVKNKMGLYQESGEILEFIYKKYREKSLSIYPISVNLKKSLFDPLMAQKEFKNRLFLDDRYKYSLLFYYAPYQVFNQNTTINKITKGTKKIAIHSIKPAISYLRDSESISVINISITKALKKISNNKIYEAIKILEDVKSLYPTHSTIYYNLALSYAQLFNFKKAYKNFSKSYALDSHNYFALIFKALTARLRGIEIPSKDLDKLAINTKNPTALSLVEISQDSLGLDLAPLDASKNAFNGAINLLFAYKQNDLQKYKKSALSIKNAANSDIVSNVIYLDALHDKSDIKTYAKAIQQTIGENNIDTTSLYSGGFLAKEFYIRMHNIAGITHLIDKQLENYENTHKNSISFLHTVALSSIYNENFDKAYKLYNNLIDKYNQKDTHTLFLAGVSAIGSNHHANAVALFELSKLTDKSNMESKYALGLLYHEAKNLEGASIQYKKIGNSGFKSNYFEFKLKK